MSYQQAPTSYPPPGYSHPYPPPPPQTGYAYPGPFPPSGFYPPPPQPPGYQSYFNDEYGQPGPPPPQPPSQMYYHHHHQHEDDSCPSFMKGWKHPTATRAVRHLLEKLQRLWDRAEEGLQAG